MEGLQHPEQITITTAAGETTLQPAFHAALMIPTADQDQTQLLHGEVVAVVHGAVAAAILVALAEAADGIMAEADLLDQAILIPIPILAEAILAEAHEVPLVVEAQLGAEVALVAVVVVHAAGTKSKYI